MQSLDALEFSWGKGLTPLPLEGEILRLRCSWAAGEGPWQQEQGFVLLKDGEEGFLLGEYKYSAGRSWGDADLGYRHSQEIKWQRLPSLPFFYWRKASSRYYFHEPSHRSEVEVILADSLTAEMIQGFAREIGLALGETLAADTLGHLRREALGHYQRQSEKSSASVWDARASYDIRALIIRALYNEHDWMGSALLERFQDGRKYSLKIREYVDDLGMTFQVLEVGKHQMVFAGGVQNMEHPIRRETSIVERCERW